MLHPFPDYSLHRLKRTLRTLRGLSEFAQVRVDFFEFKVAHDGVEAQVLRDVRKASHPPRTQHKEKLPSLRADGAALAARELHEPTPHVPISHEPWRRPRAPSQQGLGVAVCSLAW